MPDIEAIRERAAGAHLAYWHDVETPAAKDRAALLSLVDAQQAEIERLKGLIPGYRDFRQGGNDGR